jgi:hypothetical protein
MFSKQTDCKSFSPRNGFLFIWCEINARSDFADIRKMLFQFVFDRTLHFSGTLLDRASHLGKDITCIRRNQMDCAHYNNEDHRQHDRVFGYILAVLR